MVLTNWFCLLLRTRKDFWSDKCKYKPNVTTLEKLHLIWNATKISAVWSLTTTPLLLWFILIILNAIIIVYLIPYHNGLFPPFFSLNSSWCLPFWCQEPGQPSQLRLKLRSKSHTCISILQYNSVVPTWVLFQIVHWHFAGCKNSCCCFSSWASLLLF